MKIYLSKYWNNNSIFMLVMIALIIICTVIFCALMPDEENYILVILVALFGALQCFLLSLSLKLVRYVAVEDNFLVMYSFAGKRLSSIDLNSKTYFKIFHLLEGVFSARDFLVISNSYIDLPKKVKGLAELCKLVDANKDQIILPYDNPYIERLKSERC